MPEPTTQCKMPLLFIFMNSFVAILTNMKTKINYLILKRFMFLLELYLFFIHRDFVKGICKERSKRNQYVRPTCLQHQAFFFTRFHPPERTHTPPLPLLVSGGLKHFYYFHTILGYFFQERFFASISCSINETFFFWWCMINDNCLKQCNRGDG